MRRLLRYFVALVLHNNGTLIRHAKLFELLGACRAFPCLLLIASNVGNVTRVCVIERDGILTQGEDTPETVVVLEDKPQTLALSRDPSKVLLSLVLLLVTSLCVHVDPECPLHAAWWCAIQRLGLEGEGAGTDASRAELPAQHQVPRH